MTGEGGQPRSSPFRSHALRIAPYRDTEAAEVAQFFAESAALDVTLRREAPSLEAWRAFTAQSYNREARDFCVARDGSRLVAVLTSTLLPGGDHPRRHFRIVVRPEERRKGIGTLLLNRVEQQEPMRGVVLQCNCVESWTAGRAFLTQAGFRVERRQWKMELDPTNEFPNALPPGWKIRPHGGTVTDDREWLRLDHDGYSEDDDAQWPSENDLAARRRQRGFRFWFLEREGSAVGFLHATATNRAHVHSVVVWRDHRGRALGYALMVHAIHAMRAEGAIGFTLHVRADNAPAVRLYQGLGFEVVERTETWQRISP